MKVVENKKLKILLSLDKVTPTKILYRENKLFQIKVKIKHEIEQLKCSHKV